MYLSYFTRFAPRSPRSFFLVSFSRSPSTMPAAPSAPVTKVSKLSNGATVITRESGQLVRKEKRREERARAS